MKTSSNATMLGLAAVLAMGAVAFPATGRAQSAVSVSPAKGQSAEQMAADKSECSSIAQQSAASSTPPPAAPQRGGAVRGAARGAALGAATANSRGGDAYDHASDKRQEDYRQEQAGKGAAAGAVVGASRQRRENAQAAQNQQAAGQQAVDSAYRSCLMGRGYNVQ